MEFYILFVLITITRRIDSNKCWRVFGKGVFVYSRWEGKDKIGVLESVGDFIIYTKFLYIYVFTVGLLFIDKK